MWRGRLLDFLICICLASCVSSFVPAVFMAAYSAQTGSVTAAVLPSSINASVNQNFSIDIDISNVLDLYGWEFKLGWNASLLSEVSVSEGPFLNSSGNTFFTYYLNTTDEHVVVDCTLLGQVPGVNGNGTLATITFYTVDVGQTPLHLYEVTLVNSADELINCTSQDGYGTFNLQVDPDLGGCKMPYLM